VKYQDIGILRNKVLINNTLHVVAGGYII